MPIIIDGWNLIRDHRSDIDDVDGDSLESAALLINILGDFQRTHADPITLVFDSTHEYLNMRYSSTPKLKIVAARNADEYIKKYIDNFPDGQRGNLRVVSSDGDIFYYAKSRYASPIKSEQFWKKLRP
ncbi:MAG: NYN domain-containing protein [Candidatus Omnitrophota bacterium]